MVIKDLLNKVAKPADPKNPEVQQLRDKLDQLRGRAQQQPSLQQQKANNPQTAKPTPAPKPAGDRELDALTKASEEERRRFAQDQDPGLIVKQERTQKLVAKQITEMIEFTSELNKRIAKLESDKQSSERKVQEMQKRNDEMQQKMQVIDQRLEKFMGLYEVITNQYNPFSNAPKDGEAPVPNMIPKGVVRVDDNLTGTVEEVPFEQGSISSENALKMQQLLAELERDEMEKRDLDTESEIQAVEVREEETQQQLIAQMHELMSGFEGRLKSYLDDSMQAKLHGTLSNLETVLNSEIEQAVKEEVSKLKQNEDIISKALEELEGLQGQSSEPERFKEAESEVVETVRSLDDQIKAIPPSLYFRLKDGRILKSRQDLLSALEEMPADVFSHHVTDDHNDFADWLELALNDPVGPKLEKASREEMVSLLKGQA